jgi:hypothetical protein
MLAERAKAERKCPFDTLADVIYGWSARVPLHLGDMHRLWVCTSANSAAPLPAPVGPRGDEKGPLHQRDCCEPVPRMLANHGPTSTRHVACLEASIGTLSRRVPLRVLVHMHGRPKAAQTYRRGTSEIETWQGGLS